MQEDKEFLKYTYKKIVFGKYYLYIIKIHSKKIYALRWETAAQTNTSSS